MPLMRFILASQDIDFVNAFVRLAAVLQDTARRRVTLSSSRTSAEGPRMQYQHGEVPHRTSVSYFRKRVRGTVKWFNVMGGYGFFTRTDSVQDVFVHRNAMKDWRPKRCRIREGQVVEFEVIRGAKGHRAANVIILNTKPVQGSRKDVRKKHITYRRSQRRQARQSIDVGKGGNGNKQYGAASSMDAAAIGASGKGLFRTRKNHNTPHQERKPPAGHLHLRSFHGHEFQQFGRTLQRPLYTTAAPPRHSGDHHSAGTGSVLYSSAVMKGFNQGTKQDSRGATGDEDKPAVSTLKERRDIRPKGNAPFTKTTGSNLRPRVAAPTLPFLGGRSLGKKRGGTWSASPRTGPESSNGPEASG